MEVPGSYTSNALASDMGDVELPQVRLPDFPRLPVSTLEALSRVNGLAATASDVLDAMGWRLAVAGSHLQPRVNPARPVVGHALTLRYVPARQQEEAAPGLAHQLVFDLAQPGDVMVVEASSLHMTSAMGGRAASAAAKLGLGGVIVDGAVRDLDEIRAAGLPTWSESISPITGKGRFEAVAINYPITCGGVQVRAGDLVLADETGVCFLSPQIVKRAAARILEIAHEEAADLYYTNHETSDDIKKDIR